MSLRNTGPVRPSRRSIVWIGAALLLVLVLLMTSVYFFAKFQGCSGGKGNAGGAVPAIYPVPQSAMAGGATVPLSGHVTLVIGAETDPPSVVQTTNLLGDYSQNLEVITAPARPPDNGSVVYLGATADNPEAAAALKHLGLDCSEALSKSEGYVLATGRVGGQNVAILDGADASGTFYAVQTLRQVISGGSISPVVVEDWPLMSVRGTVEGFYGTPWSHQARLDQFDFYGQQKMNTYIYSPKDDPLLRQAWREEYTGDQQTELKELVDAAETNHVKFAYALSPGNDICYSRKADLDAAVTKFESLYLLGVRTFHLPLDDIAPHLNCAKDKDKFTKDTSQALADAQAYFLNAVNAQFVKKHSDIEPLLMVPTDYSGSQANPYKSELGIALDADIAVLWTGEEVVSHRITTESTRAAQMTYGAFLRPRGLVIWDNYPVNDFAPNRLFLAPVIGRDRDLYAATAGIAANPMSEPYASLPTLFNFADFTWNGPAYDPVTSMAAALKLLAGPDDDVLVSLTAFADLNQNWQDDELTPNAPGLSADIEAFWEAYYGGPDPEAATSSSALASRVGLIQTMPQTLSDMADQEFYLDTQHWIDAAGLYGDALDASLRMLAAVEADDEDDVMDARSELDAAVEEAGEATQPSIGGRLLIPEVGDGVFQEFIAEAMSVADEWLG